MVVQVLEVRVEQEVPEHRRCVTPCTVTAASSGCPCQIAGFKFRCLRTAERTRRHLNRFGTKKRGQQRERESDGDDIEGLQEKVIQARRTQNGIRNQ